jgi:hypothetical protein
MNNLDYDSKLSPDKREARAEGNATLRSRFRLVFKNVFDQPKVAHALTSHTGMLARFLIGRLSTERSHSLGALPEKAFSNQASSAMKSSRC